MKTLIEYESGTFMVDYGDRDCTAYFTRQVWDLGDGTFLTKYGSAHYGPNKIDTYWMTLWRPAPRWWNRNRRQTIRRWTER